MKKKCRKHSWRYVETESWAVAGVLTRELMKYCVKCGKEVQNP